MTNQNHISNSFMTPVAKIIQEGLVIPESANIKKDLLALLLCLGEEEKAPQMEMDPETGEAVEASDPEYDVANETIGKNIDAYQAAQVLAHITKMSKDVFVQKAIMRSLKTKGVLDESLIVMAQEAYIAGFLFIALCHALTNIDIVPEEAKVKTRADMAKIFIIGAGMSWIGTQGRFQIKKLEKEEEKAQNEMAAQGGPMGGEEEFAETPGKKNINSNEASQTSQKINEAKSLNTISPKIDKEEAATADVALGDEIEKRKKELLTFKDFFVYVNNFFLTDSEIKRIAVALVNNLNNTNFGEYLEYVSVNPWKDLYDVESLLHSNKKRGKIKQAENPTKILESLAYEYIALLTLISKDLTELYIMNRYKIQKTIIEEQQAQEEMMQQEQQGMEEQQQALEMEKQAAEVEKTKAEANSKSKPETKKKTKK